MIFHRHITRSGYMMVSVAMLTVIAGPFSEEVYSQIARFAARSHWRTYRLRPRGPQIAGPHTVGTKGLWNRAGSLPGSRVGSGDHS